MATMLGYLTTDAAVAAGAAAACWPRRAATLQRDHRRRRAVDQRLRVRPGQRRLRRHDRRRDARPALFEGFRAVARELARGIVRGGEGATKLVAITVATRRRRRRRVDGGARHRQLAAGEDRDSRRRPELGPPGRRGRPLGRALRARRAPGADRLARALRGRPAVRRAGARRPPPTCEGTDLDIEVDLGTGGARSATVWTCDLSKMYVQINAEYRT